MTNLIQNPLLVVVIILTIVVVVLIFIMLSLQRRLKSFLVDVDARNIADSLASVSDDIDELQKFRTEIESYLSNVEKRLQKSVQSVHTVRFNPYKGTGDGGNQSFATTLLTEDGSGVIISSLYSRDHVRIFAKPIKKHTSEHELSEEEAESLENAKKHIK